MKKKLKFIVPIPILLGVLFAAYTMLLAPKPAAARTKIHGTIVPMSNPFIVNLAGGHYGKLSISLLLTKAPAAPADGTPLVLPEDSVIRSIITNETTGIAPSELIDRGKRTKLIAEILQQIKKTTDEPVTQVYITDLAIQ